jgi:hypothetical protein
MHILPRSLIFANLHAKNDPLVPLLCFIIGKAFIHGDVSITAEA